MGAFVKTSDQVLKPIARSWVGVASKLEMQLSAIPATAAKIRNCLIRIVCIVKKLIN